MVLNRGGSKLLCKRIFRHKYNLKSILEREGGFDDCLEVAFCIQLYIRLTSINYHYQSMKW